MMRAPSDFTRVTVSSIALPLRMMSSTMMHGINFALIHVLAKHALALFLFGPVDLFRVERVAHAEGDRNSA